MLTHNKLRDVCPVSTLCLLDTFIGRCPVERGKVRSPGFAFGYVVAGPVATTLGAETGRLAHCCTSNLNPPLFRLAVYLTYAECQRREGRRLPWSVRLAGMVTTTGMRSFSAVWLKQVRRGRIAKLMPTCPGH